MNKTIYFGIGTIEDEDIDVVVYTSYYNDGYLTDSYYIEDQIKLNNMEHLSELMESTFEVDIEALPTNEAIINYMVSNGFVYCENLNHDSEEDEC